MKEFLEDDQYDGVDDNVEILLEEPTEDPNQAYIYVRIKARPDEEQMLIECDAEGGWLYTANTDMVTILSNGTDVQLAMCFLELFQMNDYFIEAVTAAISALQKKKGNNDG